MINVRMYVYGGQAERTKREKMELSMLRVLESVCGKVRSRSTCLSDYHLFLSNVIPQLYDLQNIP